MCGLFDWSAVLEVSGNRNLNQIELRSTRCKFLAHVSCTRCLSVCQPYKIVSHAIPRYRYIAHFYLPPAEEAN